MKWSRHCVTTFLILGGQSTVATAHAIARVVYKMLKYKVEFDPLSVNEYQAKYEEQQVKYMKKRVAKLGYQLVPA